MPSPAPWRAPSGRAASRPHAETPGRVVGGVQDLAALALVFHARLIDEAQAFADVARDAFRLEQHDAEVVAAALIVALAGPLVQGGGARLVLGGAGAAVEAQASLEAAIRAALIAGAYQRRGLGGELGGAARAGQALQLFVQLAGLLVLAVAALAGRRGRAHEVWFVLA